MAGNYMGPIKKKLGMKGAQKPGAMISRMNEMKQDKLFGMFRGPKVKTARPTIAKPIVKSTPGGSLFGQRSNQIKEALNFKTTSMKCKSCGMAHKNHSGMKHKFSDTIKRIVKDEYRRSIGQAKVPALTSRAEEIARRNGYTLSPQKSPYEAQNLVKNGSKPSKGTKSPKTRKYGK